MQMSSFQNIVFCVVLFFFLGLLVWILSRVERKKQKDIPVRTFSPRSYHSIVVKPTMIVVKPPKQNNSIYSPQNTTLITDRVLPSYVESRSVLLKDNRNVSHQPFVQQTNHRRHQTLNTKIDVDVIAHKPVNACPRVNLWKNDMCGLFV